MTDPNYPPEAILPELKGTFGREDLMTGIHRALAESYQAQCVKALVATRFPNGRIILMTENVLPLREDWADEFLIGMTSPDGAHMIVHPAWGQWLTQETAVLPTESTFKAIAGISPLIVRSHAGSG